MSDGGTSCGYGKGFTLMIVLFILLVIIGAGVAWYGGYDGQGFC